MVGLGLGPEVACAATVAPVRGAPVEGVVRTTVTVIATGWSGTSTCGAVRSTTTVRGGIPTTGGTTRTSASAPSVSVTTARGVAGGSGASVRAVTTTVSGRVRRPQ